mgnify:CR=1 FL=1
MTDLEITKLCAEAMGLRTNVRPLRGTILRHWFMDGHVEKIYDPLHDDAQAMALLRKYTSFCIDALNNERWRAYNTDETMQDIARIICKGIAKIQELQNVPPDSASGREAAQPRQGSEDGGAAGAGAPG